MGSQETTRPPRSVNSALKLAGPPPQSRIRSSRSWGVRSNIATYSAIVLPQGTTLSSRKAIASNLRCSDAAAWLRHAEWRIRDLGQAGQITAPPRRPDFTLDGERLRRNRVWTVTSAVRE